MEDPPRREAQAARDEGGGARRCRGPRPALSLEGTKRELRGSQGMGR